MGETVTLLLGKNNDIADVVTSSVTNTSVVGFLCETGTKTYTSDDLKDYSNYYIKVVTPSGEAYDYTCNQNYEDMKNSAVTVTITDGIATVTRANSAKPNGSFNWSSQKFGGEELASDLEMLDVGTTDSNGPSLYTKVYPSRLEDVYKRQAQLSQ